MPDSTLKRRKQLAKPEKVKRKAAEDSNKKPALKKKAVRFLSTLLISNVILAIFWLIFSTSPIDPVEIRLPTPPDWTGALAPNTRLVDAELLLKNEIIGAESILADKDRLITGTYDGKIVEIKNNRIIKEIRLAEGPCGTYQTEPTCGRPLGMRFLTENVIIVADAYLGIYQVELSSGNSVQLVRGGSVVDGRPLTFLNDVEVLRNGSILFTDSSSKWERRNFIFSLLEGSADGRLLVYCPITKTVRVLLDNLHFPNGIQLDASESFLLLNELAMARVLRYHLKGPKAGTVEPFVSNLPGFPDNIRLAKNGSFWLGMSAVRRNGIGFSLLDSLGPYPSLRKYLAKVIPTEYVVQLLHKFSPTYGLVVLIDENGQYVSSLHDPTGRNVPSVSEVEEHDTSLYLGSYHSRFIAKVRL